MSERWPWEPEEEEKWFYWAAVEGERGERLMETNGRPGASVGLPVVVALHDEMAKRLFRERFGFDVRVSLLMLRGEPMRAPKPVEEDDDGY